MGKPADNRQRPGPRIRPFPACWIAVVIGLFLAAPAPAARAADPPQDAGRVLSANIPLDSYIYDYLDKLAGLGYSDSVGAGTRPYTRMRAAQMVQTAKERIASAAVPAYVREILAELEREFSRELSVLAGEGGAGRPAARQMNWTAAYYDGESLPQHATASAYQPLNINNDGRRLADGMNDSLTLRFEGALGCGFFVSATPRLSFDPENGADASLDSAYLKTGLANLEIQIGKDSFRWGQGMRGCLPLTNNSAPQTTLKLSNIDPVELDGWLARLNRMNATFFWSEPERNRRDVKDPSFMGLRLDFAPGPDLAFAVCLNAIVGGDGHEFGLGDLWRFIAGRNAPAAAEDKWDSIAGADFRWRLPRLNGLEVYGELYGEDQAGFPPLPSKVAYEFGVYIPRLTPGGEWDLLLETASTTEVWYRHSLYTDGYTFAGNLIGDAMGNDALRHYVRLSRFISGASRLSFHAERVVMAKSSPVPQTVASFWSECSARLKGDLALDAAIGVAFIDNPGFRAGGSARCALLRLGLRKEL